MKTTTTLRKGVPHNMDGSKQLAIVIAVVALMFAIFASVEAYDLKEASQTIERQREEIRSVRGDLGACQGTMRGD